MDATITLREYLGRKKSFVIPAYQRGYIWGKTKINEKDTDSVSYLTNTILRNFKEDSPIFLQGVTVSETKEFITVIDGQQRTTYLYILLRLLDYKGYFNIQYKVRKESGEFLMNLNANTDVTEKTDEKYQDIFFFRKTCRIIKSLLQKDGIGKEDYETLISYILDSIKFLYINIPEAQAIKVFCMMNGNRAKMLEQEIIKAELLRLVSLTDDSVVSSDKSHEWELNLLRSRYAREWDKWIHWWNMSGVREMYNTHKQLGWLLTSIMPPNSKGDVTFESFCKEILQDEQTVSKAKRTFNLIRRVQKRFEDAFNNPIRHNKIGAILRIINNPERFIKYYFAENNVSDYDLDKYYLCAFLDMTHDMIMAKDEKEFKDYFIEKYNQKIDELKKPDIYNLNKDHKETAYRLLLRLNIDEDNLQNGGKGRKFDFSICEPRKRSLEHILAKKNVYHQENGVWYRGDGQKEEPDRNNPEIRFRDDFQEIKDPIHPLSESDFKENTPPLSITEHCIGNLVLLYSDDNSTFSCNNFQKKKEIFLVGEEKDKRKELFKSRHLLHTIYHFSESKWDLEEIARHFEITLINFEKTYRHIILKSDGKQN